MKKRTKLIALILALVLIVAATGATIAIFTDRTSHQMTITTGWFSKDGYKLKRDAYTGPFIAGETVTATLKESNSKTEDVASVISMTVTWTSPDTSRSIFDGATLTIGGSAIPAAEITKSADGKSISFDLPAHLLAAGVVDQSRELALHIPADFVSTGTLDFTFDNVNVALTNGGFSADYARDELSADPDHMLDYAANVGWAASNLTSGENANKALMGYLKASESQPGKYEIVYQYEFGYTTSGMKDFADKDASLWSNYRDSVVAITIPEKVTTVGDYCFTGFDGITELTLPGSMTAIGTSAFDGISISELIIPEDVLTFETLAFANIPELTAITFENPNADEDISLPAAGKGSGAFYVHPYVETTITATNLDALNYAWDVDYRNPPTLAAEDTWFKATSIGIGDVTEIEIMPAEYTSATATESWIADANNNGTIKCYLEGTKLIISGNGANRIYANPDSYCAFYEFENVTEIAGGTGLDMSKVTDAAYMFSSCRKLTTLDTSNWNTSNIVDATGMFSYCFDLEYLDVSKWDTGNIKYTSYGYWGMFSDCNSLGNLDVSNWDTSNMTELGRMFYCCYEMDNIDVSKWDTSKVTDMSQVFTDTAITSSGTANWDTSLVTTMDGMFSGCKNLQSIDVSKWNVQNVTDMCNMFANCDSLKSVDLSTWDESIVVHTYSMFGGCDSLESVNLVGWNMSEIVQGTGDWDGSGSMFGSCPALTKLTIPASMTQFGEHFARNCPNLTTIEFLHDKDTELALPEAGYNYGAFYAYNRVADKTADEPIRTHVITSNTDVLEYAWHDDFRGYLITAESVTGGNLIAVPSVAINGKTVALTVTPSADYKYLGATLTWTENGTEKTKTLAAGELEFVMPVSDVTITPQWKALLTGLAVTTPPDDTDYIKGEDFDPTGMVVTATYADGSTKDVTDLVAILDGEDLPVGQDKITVSYTEDGITKTATTPISVTNRLVKIEVTTPPDKTEYEPGDDFDKTGMKVTATYEDGSSRVLGDDEYTILDGEDLPLGQDKITVSYTEDGITKTATTPITVVLPMPILAAGNTWYTGTTDVGTITEIKILNDKADVPAGYTESWPAAVDADGDGTLDDDVMCYVNGSVLTIAGNGYGQVYANKDSSYAFSDPYNITSFTNGHLLNTSLAEDTSYMFYYCTEMTTLDVSKWDMSSVKNATSMFHGCGALEALDVSKWNVSAMQNMDSLFSYCYTLEALDVSKWNVGEATSMAAMFANCSGLTTLAVDDWRPAKLEYADSMFSGCAGLTTLNVSDWSPNALKSTYRMFRSCDDLTVIDVSKWRPTALVDMSEMFRGCTSLAGVDITGWNLSSITSLAGTEAVFRDCSAMTSLTLPATLKYFGEKFAYDCTSLDEINFQHAASTVLEFATAGEDTGAFYLDSYLETTFDFNGNSYAEDYDWLTDNRAKPPYFTVTYDANGGTFGGSATTNAVTYERTEQEATPRVSKTSNVSDDGSTFSGGYGDSKAITDVVTIPGATELQVTITYATESANYDWVCVYDGSVTPSASNYGSSISGKLGGSTKTTTTFTVPGDTVQFFLRSDGSASNYYGYYAVVTAPGYYESVLVEKSGTYAEPTHDTSYMKFMGWYTDESCTDGNEFDFNSLASDVTVYAKWEEVIPVLAKQSTWYTQGNPTTLPKDIISIKFMDSYTPDGTEKESWDASDGKQGTITAYVLSDNSLIIAGNGYGSIYANEDSSYAFSHVSTANNRFTAVTSITNLDLLDTSNVTNMSYMFYYCQKLGSLDVSHFDTRKVTNMGYMFNYCLSLTSLNVGTKSITLNGDTFDTWDTGAVTTMAYMFNSCFNLPTLDVSHFDTQKVTDMNHMFSYCQALTSLDLSTKSVTMNGETFDSWDTGNVTNMALMFYSCAKLPTLDVSHFDTRKVTNMAQMFALSGSVSRDGFVTLDVSTKSITMNGKTFDTWDTGSCTNMVGMFSENPRVATLDVSHFDTRKVNNMYTMFTKCSSLTSLNVGTKSITLNNETFDTWDTGSCTRMDLMFESCSKLPTLDISHFDTRKVERMDSMFSKCSSLTSLNVGTKSITLNSETFDTWDTGSCTYMGAMFYSCAKLPTLDVSHFDTRKVNTMSSMFSGCSSLTSLNVGTKRITLNSEAFDTWDTSAVTTMIGMFSNCSSLPTLDVNHFNTAKVSTMGNGYERNDSNYYEYGMFYNCSSLTSIDLVSKEITLNNVTFDTWDTSSVTTMAYMFWNCKSLPSLDLSTFDTSAITKTTNYTGLAKFAYNCPALTNIILGENFGQSTNLAIPGSTAGMFYVPTDTITRITGANDVMKAYDWATDHRIPAVLDSIEVTTPPDKTEYDEGDDFDKTGMKVTATYTDGSTRVLGDDEYTILDGTAMPGGQDKITVSYTEDEITKTATTPITIKPPAPVLAAQNTWYSQGNPTTLPKAIKSIKIVDSYTPDGTEKESWDASDGKQGTITAYVLSDNSLIIAGNGYGSIYANKDSSWLFGPGNSSTSSTYMNKRFSVVTSITGLELLDTSNVTDMRNMFYYCQNLGALDLSTWDTQKVTNMTNMFYYCRAMTTLDVSTESVTLNNRTYNSWDTGSVTNMTYMFYYCQKLTELDLSHFDTQKVTNMSYMFYYCNALIDLDVSAKTITLNNRTFDSWNTVSLTNMSNMFYYCQKLTELDLSHFDTRKVTDMTRTFMNCSSLTNIDSLSSWNVSIGPILASTFEGCGKLTNVDALSSWDVSKVTIMSQTFRNCSSLTDIDSLSSWNVSIGPRLASTFEGCRSLTNLDALSSWDVSNVTVLSGIFRNCSTLTDISALSNWTINSSGSSVSADYIFAGCSSLVDVDALSTWDTKYVVSLTYAFSSCSSLADLSGISNWDLSGLNVYGSALQHTFESCMALTNLDDLSTWVLPDTITSLAYTFFNCQGLINVDGLSTWDVSNIKSLEKTFSQCNHLADISALSNWNITNKLTSLYQTFSYCPFTDVDELSNWDVSNVTTMQETFKDCGQLYDIDALGNWKTAKVTNMSSTFYGCSALSNLSPLSSWNVSSVTNFSRTFEKCRSLKNTTALMLWNTKSASNMSHMFSGCTSLTTLNVSGFDTSAVVSTSSNNGLYRFAYDCTALKTVILGENFGQSGKLQAPGSASGLFYVANATETTVYNANDVMQAYVWTKDNRTPVIFSTLSNPVLAAGNSWYTGATDKNAITSITLTPLYMPTGSETESWPAAADANGDGTLDDDIMCYVNGTDLIIATNNGARGLLANTDSSYAFSGFSSVTSVDGLELLDTQSTANMASMFEGCASLTQLDLSTFNTTAITNSAAGTGLSRFAYGCDNLGTVVVGTSFGQPAIIPAPGSNTGMFYTSTLTDLVLYGQNLSVLITYNWAADNRASDFPSPTLLPGNTWYTTNIRKALITELTIVDSYTPSGDESGSWPAAEDRDGDGVYEDDITCYLVDDGSGNGTYRLIIAGNGTGRIVANTNSSQAFRYFESAVSMTGFDLLDTSSCTNMSSMFAQNMAVTELDLSNFDTQKVTNMSNMFWSCRSLTDIDLSAKTIEKNGRTYVSWDTSSCTNMYQMFYQCYAVTELDLSAFNTQSVTNMNEMFSQCSALTTLNISSFDTSSISGTSSNMTYIEKFARFCDSLTTVILGEKFGASCFLPRPGYNYGLFYVNTNTAITVVGANDAIKAYSWASDNRTPTFVDSLSLQFDPNTGSLSGIE